MNGETARRPSWTRVSSEKAARYTEDTRKGRYELRDTEKVWRDLHPTLRRRGFRLRPRYEVDWTPSWLGTDVNPLWCEDSITPRAYNIIDATRESDRLVVAIKRVDRAPHEVEIAKFLSSPALRGDPYNHCVPILDVFSDPVTPDRTYIVMPNLRPFNDPEFMFFGEVLDFVGQTLQGLSFMHDHLVAHLDCAAFNIMMDATPLFPQGWHPLRREYAPDAFTQLLTPPSRTDRPVRYYFIDFGLSVRFRAGESSFISTRGRIPQEKTVPELALAAPYDAYKVDIYILGCVYRKDLYQKFSGLDFLAPLISAMTDQEPSRRPSASDAVVQFRRLYEQLDSANARWRLHPVDETMPERVVRDTMAAVNSIMRFVGQQ
ncbi:hypothetical protein PLICRDRAFT_170840 [Plicaturopsis crispa FD-325 SS-3]|nr:hypothetical protein PLICRDRAFT_170840 [Plicaturopsis crispa FD-325 SS-3]